MAKTFLLLAGAVSLCGIAMAGNRSYDITLASVAKVGALRLAAGDYKLKIEGSNAVFMDPHTRKTFTTPAKVEAASHKFSHTAVETALDGETERITAIDLEGSTTQIGFANQ